jgi:hypothetical protein
MMMQPMYVQQPVQQRGNTQPGRFEPPPWPPRSNQQPPPQQAQVQPPPQPGMTARAAMADTPKLVAEPLVPTPRLTPVSLPPPEAVGVAPVRTVSLPSPEDVGVGAAAKIDWNDAHTRLERLGNIGMTTGQTTDGRHRVSLVLRTSRTDSVQRIEAVASTEAEAVALALAKAEEWSRSGR